MDPTSLLEVTTEHLAFFTKVAAKSAIMARELDLSWEITQRAAALLEVDHSITWPSSTSKLTM